MGGLVSRRSDLVLATIHMIFGDAHADGRFLDEIVTHGVPYVLVNRRAGAQPSVTCDDCLGGRPAAEHRVIGQWLAG
ncbi:hypothetical protein [Streptomyces sp. R41]|uniref:Uncharacterized protein n=1 Tax=Streptomyces sp. R41 TaxID=3238632 RepID=A0AB39RRJ1_9ACTN